MLDGGILFGMTATKKADPKHTAKLLLNRYGKTFAEELDIDLAANTPSELFCLLTAALLFSARIGHTIALKSARILFERGWTTPEKLARTTWQQRVAALDEGGYVRYDERTSAMLGQTAEMLIERYGGDLRKVREAAAHDPARERKLLKEFKGIGDVGVNIFFREVQLVWPELFPFADERILANAKNLGLPPDPNALARMVHGRRDFVRLVSALVRIQLEHKEDEFSAILAA
jgi:endonuclease III